MANRKELRDARRKAAEATASLQAIASLPRRVGSLVMWNNGVIWERRGDDDWHAVAHTLADGTVEAPDPVSAAVRYSSAHVAQFECWETGRGALPEEIR
ncbi:hypothetical protein SEA_VALENTINIPUFF_45 [Microbacterium phage ValentiniPuff]|uniref:Uncharacterized protein n=1 Tax=Microbacterium phage ValentiniPuff TaxID=2315705 RepID=A0A386KPI3_9CAUD|nr:hypothetical protein SEA_VALENTINIPUFF_45 [Microbacterium phage ValentiniPuff]